MSHVDGRGRPAAFVAAADEAPSGQARRLGILRGGGTRRLMAAERIATALGIVVPAVEAAVVKGEVGTLRESVEGCVALSDLRAADPAGAEAVEASATWREGRAAASVVDHVLGTVGRTPSLLLVLSLGRVSHHCILAPWAECLAPLPTSAPVPVAALSAAPWTGERAISVAHRDIDLEARLGIGGLLSGEELARFTERLHAVAAISPSIGT